jgi:hypothetical protein
MRLLLVLFILQLSLIGYSQTAEYNHEKYWHYRYRMKHYFNPTGPDIYQSMVGARRNSWMDTDITFGDQTLDMGWYMGILAIEYNLLKYRNDPDELNETLTDLYYLMKAFERLDRNEGRAVEKRKHRSFEFCKCYWYYRSRNSCLSRK